VSGNVVTSGFNVNYLPSRSTNQKTFIQHCHMMWNIYWWLKIVLEGRRLSAALVGGACK